MDELSALLKQAEEEAQRASERLARVRRDYTDGKLEALDWIEFRDELGGESTAAGAEVERLQSQLSEARSHGSDAENVVLERLVQIRRAVVGEEASGVAAVRAALARMFERFVLHRAEGAPSGVHAAELALVPGFVIEPIIRPEAIESDGEFTPVIRRAPLQEAENNHRKGSATGVC